MRANLTIIAAILVFSVWSTPAEAERRCLCGRPPTENVYEGLLAADFTPVDASAQFQPSALRDAKLAVISSSNFNEYARRWAYWYDEDNIDRYWAFQLFGQTRDNTREYEENTDPRRFGERLVVLLEPYVDQVVIAPDLQQAREQGATYFLVLDAWTGTNNRNNDRWKTWAGIHILDASLQRVFEATAEQEARRPILNIAGDQRASVNAYNAATEQVLETLRLRLGPPPNRQAN